MVQIMRGTVHTLLLRRNEAFLMRRVNAISFDGLWTPPAGHVESGEHILAAAVRETFEESGVIVSKESLNLIGTQHRPHDSPPYIDFFFECRQWIGEPMIGEPTKFDRFGWFPIDDVPEPCIPGVRRMLEARHDWPVAL